MTWEELAAKINDMRVGDRQKTVRFVESYDKDFAINEPELLQATDVLSDGETIIQPEEFYLG